MAGLRLRLAQPNRKKIRTIPSPANASHSEQADLPALCNASVMRLWLNMYRYFIAAGAPGSLAQGAPALEGWAVASAREPTSRETVSQARIVGCRSHGRAGCFQEQLRGV
jgi:hypothetical protein